VLVVDDYDLNLVVTRRILEGAGALVCVANNGQEACEKLQHQPVDVDIVLMEVQMPVMDGYEATRRIRTNLARRDVPIIALTAGALVSERQRATAVGMDDFIIKPFDAATLISSVMRHTVRAHVATEKSGRAAQTTNGSVAWPEVAGINTQDARRRFCNDAALFCSLLQSFLNDFSDFKVPSSGEEPPCLAEQAMCLHKLMGGAGFAGSQGDPASGGGGRGGLCGRGCGRSGETLY
jgi:CheY-like chemotaxis protein